MRNVDSKGLRKKSNALAFVMCPIVVFPVCFAHHPLKEKQVRVIPPQSVTFDEW